MSVALVVSINTDTMTTYFAEAVLRQLLEEDWRNKIAWKLTVDQVITPIGPQI